MFLVVSLFVWFFCFVYLFVWHLFACLFVGVFVCASWRPGWAAQQEEDRRLLLPLPVTCSPASRLPRRRRRRLPRFPGRTPSPPPPPPPFLAVAAWWRDGRAVLRMRTSRASAPLASCVFKRGLVWPCFPFKIRCLKHTTTAQAASQAAHSSGSKDFSPRRLWALGDAQRAWGPSDRWVQPLTSVSWRQLSRRRGRVNLKFGEVYFLLLPVVARTKSFSDAGKQSDQTEGDNFQCRKWEIGRLWILFWKPACWSWFKRRFLQQIYRFLTPATFLIFPLLLPLFEKQEMKAGKSLNVFAMFCQDHQVCDASLTFNNFVTLNQLGDSLSHCTQCNGWDSYPNSK